MLDALAIGTALFVGFLGFLFRGFFANEPGSADDAAKLLLLASLWALLNAILRHRRLRAAAMPHQSTISPLVKRLYQIGVALLVTSVVLLAT